MEFKANKKGITLIALVITIIVMLILVAVTISMALNGGLFTYAKSASRDTKTAMEKEKELTSVEEGLSADDLINKYTKKDGEPLVSKAKVGDLVAYNPGNGVFKWSDYSYDSTYFASSSDGTQNNYTASNYNGKWKIVQIKDGKVYLVSEANTGDLYLFGATAGADVLRASGMGAGWYNPDESYVNILDRISSIYVNSKYASKSITISDKTVKELFDITDDESVNINEKLGSTSFEYWIASGDVYEITRCQNIAIETSSSQKMLVEGDCPTGACIGTRVIIELKDGIATTGQNSNGEWVLVEN